MCLELIELEPIFGDQFWCRVFFAKSKMLAPALADLRLGINSLPVVSLKSQKVQVLDPACL